MSAVYQRRRHAAAALHCSQVSAEGRGPRSSGAGSLASLLNRPNLCTTYHIGEQNEIMQRDVDGLELQNWDEQGTPIQNQSAGARDICVVNF